jgi:hypothetical protein
MTSAEDLICATLRGEAPEWPDGNDEAAAARFIGSLRFHGMTALFGAALAGSARGEGWPASVAQWCREQNIAQAVVEMSARAELARVLKACAEARIRPLLLKGAALAYSHYPNPVLRPRGDVDLLVPQFARQAAETTLRRLGYVEALQVAGEFASYQAGWSYRDTLGVDHEIDLHWRIHNSQLLSRLLDYEELVSRAQPLPELAPHALAPSPVHALLFACLHRAGHRSAPVYLDGAAHAAGDRLIWLYDVHLLVSRMSADELEEFAALAERKQMRAICRDALLRCVEGFHTRVPGRVLERLSWSGPVEPSERYCSGGRKRQAAEDLLALGSVAARARWLGEQAFPSAAYMHHKYDGSPVSWLPVLYARRLLSGAWKMLRGHS